MPVLKAKPRLVTFRLSVEEYELMRHLCLVSEHRSLSAFARAAVIERATMAVGRAVAAPAVAPAVMPVPPRADLGTVFEQLEKLSAEINDLKSKLTGTPVR